MTIHIITIIIFCIASLLISIVDIKTFHIPLLFNYLGIIICTILLFPQGKEIFINHILGAVILFLLFLLVSILSHKGIGLGDIQYSIFCGLISGIPGLFFSALFASFTGLIAFFLIFLSRKIRKTNAVCRKIPFTPFMFTGTLITYFLPMEKFTTFFL